MYSPASRHGQGRSVRTMPVLSSLLPTTVAADEELLADCADALMLVMLPHVRILRGWLTLLMLLLLPLRMCGARECCCCW